MHKFFFTCVSSPRFGELIVIRPSVYNEVQLDRQVDILTSDVTKQRRRLRVIYVPRASVVNEGDVFLPYMIWM